MDLLKDEEKAEAEATPSHLEFDQYDDCLTNVSQNVIDKLMMSDDEHDEVFEGFFKVITILAEIIKKQLLKMFLNANKILIPSYVQFIPKLV